MPSTGLSTKDLRNRELDILKKVNKKTNLQDYNVTP
jgi:hypothetical protein